MGRSGWHLERPGPLRGMRPQEGPEDALRPAAHEEAGRPIGDGGPRHGWGSCSVPHPAWVHELAVPWAHYWARRRRRSSSECFPGAV
eukprot:5961283-Pyramimonas_sp.AAC.1